MVPGVGGRVVSQLRCRAARPRDTRDAARDRVGYVLAVVAALAIAVARHFSSALRRALLPLLVLSQTVPTVLLAPILAILLG